MTLTAALLLIQPVLLAPVAMADTDTGTMLSVSTFTVACGGTLSREACVAFIMTVIHGGFSEAVGLQVWGEVSSRLCKFPSAAASQSPDCHYDAAPSPLTALLICAAHCYL